MEKIQITESDIQWMTKKAVKMLAEQASMRDVRKIIINNILAKHWAFQDENVAWAYYVTTHQRRREGGEDNIPEELHQRLRAALQKESETVAKEKAQQAEIDREASEWLANNPFDLSEIGWDPERTDYSEDELRQLCTDIREFYQKKGGTTLTKTNFRTGGELKVHVWSYDRVEKKNEAIENVYRKLCKLQQSQSKFEYLDAGWVNGHEDRMKAGDPEMIEINKRFMLISQDKDAVTINTYSEIRGFNGYFNGKYNMYWQVDSSD